MFRTITTAALAALMATAAHAATPAEKPVTIVLVHGAFVDGSGWKKVYDHLTADGYEVIVVQNSTETLDGDVATTERSIAVARHPVVLVGHSYGGMVITEAGADPKVASLAYIAAFAPDEGESVASLIAKPVPGYAPLPIIAKDGFLTMDVKTFPNFFAPDIDPATAKFMAASQVAWGKVALDTKVTTAAWKSKPTYWLLTTQDKMIPTPAQRVMAARAKAHVTEVDSNHAVMLAHPDIVVSYIEKIAATAK